MDAGWRTVPEEMVFFLRTPEGKAPVGATLNGKALPASAIDGETIRLKAPEGKLNLTVRY